MNHHAKEVQSRERFEFGANWSRFLTVLNEERIMQAETSLKRMLEVDDLKGKCFLDVGSGSGLFSLAARRLGARVYSFDYDPQSVACTELLKTRYFPEDKDWTVETGSVLDNDYLSRLGKFDIVYSWGVLHHTGAMWEALNNIIPTVHEGGKLFIAIYNDQGGQSRRWHRIKKVYNTIPKFLKLPYAVLIMGPRELKLFFIYFLKANPSGYFQYVTNYKKYSQRGMSYWHDIIDWIGGYPFEVAKPEKIFKFFYLNGFHLYSMRTCGGGLGCNEYIFIKN